MHAERRFYQNPVPFFQKLGQRIDHLLAGRKPFAPLPCSGGDLSPHLSACRDKLNAFCRGIFAEFPMKPRRVRPKLQHIGQKAHSAPAAFRERIHGTTHGFGIGVVAIIHEGQKARVDHRVASSDSGVIRNPLLNLPVCHAEHDSDRRALQRRIDELSSECRDIGMDCAILILNTAARAAFGQKLDLVSPQFAVFPYTKTQDSLRACQLAQQRVIPVADHDSIFGEKIQHLRLCAEDAVQVMQTGVEQVASGTAAVDGAGDTFREIANMVTEVAAQSKRMEEIVGGLNSSTDVISNAVVKISDMSKNASQESETVSASTEEQTATVHEIANACRNLSSLAQELQSVVQQFKI